MSDESRAIRRYYFDEEEMARIEALPDDQQAEIDTRLGESFGAGKVRLNLALSDIREGISRALPPWLQRLLRQTRESQG